MTHFYAKRLVQRQVGRFTPSSFALLLKQKPSKRLLTEIMRAASDERTKLFVEKLRSEALRYDGLVRSFSEEEKKAIKLHYERIWKTFEIIADEKITTSEQAREHMTVLLGELCDRGYFGAIKGLIRILENSTEIQGEYALYKMWGFATEFTSHQKEIVNEIRRVAFGGNKTAQTALLKIRELQEAESIKKRRGLKK